MKTLRLLLVLLVLALLPGLASAHSYFGGFHGHGYNFGHYYYGRAYASNYYGGYGYGYSYPYYAPGYSAPYYGYQWYPANIYGGRWFPAGNYSWYNGAWYRQGYGYEYGVALPVAPLTTQVLTLPAGLPATTLGPAPPAQTVAPPKPANGNGLSEQDIIDLKAVLKELRKPQPPTAK